MEIHNWVSCFSKKLKKDILKDAVMSQFPHCGINKGHLIQSKLYKNIEMKHPQNADLCQGLNKTQHAPGSVSARRVDH